MIIYELENYTKHGYWLQKCCIKFSTRYLELFRINSVLSKDGFSPHFHKFSRITWEPTDYFEIYFFTWNDVTESIIINTGLNCEMILMCKRIYFLVIPTDFHPNFFLKTELEWAYYNWLGSLRPKYQFAHKI